VKPERQRVDAQGKFVLRTPLPQRWWHYADKRPRLYSSIAGMERVLVTAQTSRTQWPAYVGNGLVYAHKLVVFALPEARHFAMLASSAHYFWVAAYGSTLKTDAVYTPSDCFETFPFPTSLDALDAIGERHHTHRATCCKHFDEGLTRIANRFHDPTESSPLIRELRNLHVELDRQVLAAYDWSDLPLDHGLRGSGKDTRFTISEPIRQELLDRLLELNHQRHAEGQRGRELRTASTQRHLFDIEPREIDK
jgi:hypothetical protein